MGLRGLLLAAALAVVSAARPAGAQDEPRPEPPAGELLEVDAVIELVGSSLPGDRPVTGPDAVVPGRRGLAGATGMVRVELTYRLRPRPGTVEIPVRLLPLDGTRVLAPTASVWEDPVALELAPDSAGLPRGVVRLPAPSREGDVVSLRLRYRVGAGTPAVDPGDAVRVRVPILSVPWPPAEARPGIFVARATVPAGTALYDGFPAIWREASGGSGGSVGAAGAAPGGAGGVRRYRAELPVLPALVSFRATPGPAPTTLPVVLTRLVLGLLVAALVGGAVGLRMAEGR